MWFDCMEYPKQSYQTVILVIYRTFGPQCRKRWGWWSDREDQSYPGRYLKSYSHGSLWSTLWYKVFEQANLLIGKMKTVQDRQKSCTDLKCNTFKFVVGDTVGMFGLGVNI